MMRWSWMPPIAVSLCALACPATHANEPLHDAVIENRIDSVRTLLANGTPADLRDANGLSALTTAARYGRLQIMEILVSYGADVDLRSGRNDWTPLLHAIHKNQLRAVAKLLELGADVNRGTRKGKTPLMMAAGYGQTGTIRLLLDRPVTDAGAAVLSPAMTLTAVPRTVKPGLRCCAA